MATHPKSNSVGPHGAAELPHVAVDTYNLEMRDAEGFIGDRASKRAFADMIDDWRDRLRRVDEDPLGDKPTAKIRKKKLDDLLANGEPKVAGLIHGVIEEFAQEFSKVIRKFLRAKGWQDTQRIVIGGGFREGRIGELAIGRTMVLLKGEGVAVDLQPIRSHPDDAGLLGAVHLMPAWMMGGHDAILAVDIGGTNLRCGVVRLNAKKEPRLIKAEMHSSELWRHDDDKPNRGEAVARMIEMLKALLKKAAGEGVKVAPLIGVGCPGIIEADGSIVRGGQNLPGGNWESGAFNLPNEIAKELPEIAGHDTMVVMHNDAVVQGLSELPFMRDVERWGVLTIGTGLGNARFTNRARAES